MEVRVHPIELRILQLIVGIRATIVVGRLGLTVPIDDGQPDGYLAQVTRFLIGPQVTDELFEARCVDLRRAHLQRDLIPCAEPKDVLVPAELMQDEFSPCLEFRRVAIRRRIDGDGTILALGRYSDNGMYSRSLECAHEGIVVEGWVDGVNADSVDAKQSKLFNISLPDVTVLLGEKVDAVCQSELSLVRARVVVNAFDRHVFTW